ncbi:hypothetical protein NDU88_008045 [Pleurodeles waltl]|uniref:Uncharacterized protein n=1 Tax=Pleurodeles waltl TaxID=8319 RepID=A0AAV7SU93_PLEWA|nr:hypothetical protein NDU88_008045 [Pleurodeles waltl]
MSSRAVPREEAPELTGSARARPSKAAEARRALVPGMVRCGGQLPGSACLQLLYMPLMRGNEITDFGEALPATRDAGLYSLGATPVQHRLHLGILDFTPLERLQCSTGFF